MSNCFDNALSPACFTAADGTKTTIWMHAVYEAGVPIGYAYSPSTDPTLFFDVTGGTVTPGACPVIAPDVEFQALCDVQADGSTVQFFCRTVTTFELDGSIDTQVVTNLELDKVTPYTPTGTVELCAGGDDCVPVGNVGLITDWTVLTP